MIARYLRLSATSPRIDGMLLEQFVAFATVPDHIRLVEQDSLLR